MKRLLPMLIAGCLVAGATNATAQTTHEEVINGASCVPYPAPGNNNNAFQYHHLLYAYGQSASCHITMSGEWPVSKLSYVLFTGVVNSGTVNARICVHTGGTSLTCGAWGSLTQGQTVNWVSPPALPAYAAGAFLEFTFPSGAWSLVAEVIPVWVK